MTEFSASFEEIDDPAEKLKMLKSLMGSELKGVTKNDRTFKFDETEFESDFAPYVNSLFDKDFDFPVPAAERQEMIHYLFEYISREKNVSNHETGIVFCGFGEEEIYPVLIEKYLDGRWKGVLRQWAGRSYDFNKERGNLGTVVPFAQRDMANIFMEGISMPFAQFFHTSINEVLKKKTDRLIAKYEHDVDARKKAIERERKNDRRLLTTIFEAFSDLRQMESIQPLMSAIRSLPREEMSAMAEALVELTSLRRKIDSRVQSVAGPVDVAFISKGDGVVWMKRKFYFNEKINGDYSVRRAKRLS